MRVFLASTILMGAVALIGDTQAEAGTRRVAVAARSARAKRTIASLPSKIRTQTTEREIKDPHQQSGTGLALYLGAGGGYLSVSAADPSAEPNKSGFGLLGRASVSFHNPHLIMDLGVGWLQSSISGSSIVVSGNTTKSLNSSVFTRAGEIDFSPRLKLASGFEAGPAAMVLLGTDSSFSGQNGSINTPVLAGAKGGYTWGGAGQFYFRATAQLLTSVSFQNQRVFLSSLGLEIGLPVVGGKTIIREREIRTVQQDYKIETIEREKEIIREVVLFSFDDQVIHFEYDKASLTPDSRQFLDRLGRFLASHPDLWGTTRIDGHTDDRGTDSYNLKLSEARAETIRRTLLEAGVPSERLASQGFGKQRPIDLAQSDVSRARNRRVELSFSDVKDARALRDEINRIRFASIRPQTCVGDSCH